MKAIVGVLFMVSVFVVGCLGLAHCDGFSFSDGERVGILTKVSHKGMVYKTWEADLKLVVEGTGGMPLAAGDWEFSISDDAVARRAQEFAREGCRVVVKYKQYRLRGGAQGETEYDAVAVDRAVPR